MGAKSSPKEVSEVVANLWEVVQGVAQQTSCLDFKQHKTASIILYPNFGNRDSKYFSITYTFYIQT